VLRSLLLAFSFLAAGLARAEPAVHDMDWFDE
jgi:hypothetical protein